MQSKFKSFVLEEGVRYHPWTTALRDEKERYYDFRECPDLIPKVLEDFLPWDSYPAIQTFYELLRWLNGPDSKLESNDCAFSGIKENGIPQVPKTRGCNGRLMFFLRDIPLNLSPDSEAAREKLKQAKQVVQYKLSRHLQWLGNRSLELIQNTRVSSEYTFVELEIHPVYYSDAPVDENKRLGYELSFKFWAWGDTDEETMRNLHMVVETMFSSLKQISKEMRSKK
jgi:hypothetical protein